MIKLLTDAIKNSDFQEIAEEYQRSRKKRREEAYNVFTLSSYSCERENFHSDIISSFLDPNGLHNEGDVFLKLFITYLEKNFEVEIESGQFAQVNVYRERGRIDILILDNASPQNAIVIENKMNNAPDMDDQLERYYEYCERNRYKVCAVIYLTLNGLKIPPLSERVKPIRITAFNGTGLDLVKGWLEPCKVASQGEDGRSLLHEYIKLIIFLSHRDMSTNNYAAFYEFISNHGLFQLADTLEEMLAYLPTYRADQLIRTIDDDYQPFTFTSKYKPYYVVYERYLVGKYQLKLDICFNRDGNVRVLFWIPNCKNEEGFRILTEKLESIGMLGEMKAKDIDYEKIFTSENKNLKTTDDEVIGFVKKLMGRLRK